MKYLALIYRPSGSAARCGRGCCGADYSDSMLEKLSTDDRTEVIRFFTQSFIDAEVHEAEHEYAEREHHLYADGIAHDEWGDPDAPDMEALLAEARTGAAVRREQRRLVEAEKAKVEEERRARAQHEADVQRLSELDRQREELAKKLGTP